MGAAMDSIFSHASSLVKRQQGSHQSAPGTSSVSAIIATLIPVLILCLVYIALFILLRPKFPRIYQPRTYLGRFRDFEKTPAVSQSRFGFIKDVRAIPDDYVLNHQSIDGYLWIRFIKMLSIICFVGACITWPILFPVNATGGAGAKELAILSMANVKNPNRFYAHALLAWIFLGFVMYIVARESVFYIHLRQAYLLTPFQASTMSNRTVCFTDVPDAYRNEAKLRAMFPHVKHVWIVTDYKELQKLVEERDKTALKLEAAEIKLSKTTNDARLKAKKKGGNLDDPVQWADEHRPTHKLKPLIGQKVDTIDWSRNQLKELIPRVETMQAQHWNGKANTVGAVFVEFESVQAAESAYQQVVYHKPKGFQARTIGIPPTQIIWGNLGMNWINRDVRYALATAGVIVLLFMWSPFVLFCASLTNINQLESVSWLAWISKIPSAILGIITGLLPSVLLAVLMALVPIVLRLVAKLCGPVSLVEVEMITQNWYFAFQVVQVFLVTTFGSAAVAVGKNIANNPASAVTLLSAYLPTASDFYLSYFILLGINTFGAALAIVAALAIYIALGKLLDKTPRKKFNRFTSIKGIGWGAAYPVITNVGVIALSYAMIAPLILGFAAISFYLIYLATRYNVLFTLDTLNFSAQGRHYPRALQHLTVGVYLSEFCLIGLFAVNAGKGPAGAGPVILMVLLAIVTILFHIAVKKALKPLRVFLPRDLLAESTRKMAHGSQMDAAENGQAKPHPALGQDKTTLAYDQEVSASDPVLTAPEQQGFVARWMHRIFHPSGSIPKLAQYMSTPGPDYTADIRREAYLNPSITSPAPLIWIVRDDMGISAREKAETAKIINVSDHGAWWDDEKKGALVTEWEQPGNEEGGVRNAPIFEERIHY